MDTLDIPQLNSPQLSIARIKDNILKYLSDSSKPEPSEKIYYELKLDLPREDYNEHFRAIAKDDYIIVKELSGYKKILTIKDKGKIFLRDGGYTKKIKDDFNNRLDKRIEEEKRREKLDLEIQSLRAGMKHYKNTRIIAIIALVISGLSIIYLLTKDILLKLILPNN